MEAPALPGAPRTWVLCPRHCDQADPGLLWRPRHGPGILPTKSDNTRAEKNAPQTHRLLKRCPKELPQSCQMEDRTRERNRNTPSGGRAPRGSIFPSLRVFSGELALRIRWPKDWSFSFCISPSNNYSGLIFIRIDWFDLAVQGTLRSLFQHHR